MWTLVSNSYHLASSAAGLASNHRPDQGVHRRPSTSSPETCLTGTRVADVGYRKAGFACYSLRRTLIAYAAGRPAESKDSKSLPDCLHWPHGCAGFLGEPDRCQCPFKLTLRYSGIGHAMCSPAAGAKTLRDAAILRRQNQGLCAAISSVNCS